MIEPLVIPGLLALLVLLLGFVVERWARRSALWLDDVCAYAVLDQRRRQFARLPASLRLRPARVVEWVGDWPDELELPPAMVWMQIVFHDESVQTPRGAAAVPWIDAASSAALLQGRTCVVFVMHAYGTTAHKLEVVRSDGGSLRVIRRSTQNTDSNLSSLRRMVSSIPRDGAPGLLVTAPGLSSRQVQEARAIAATLGLRFLPGRKLLELFARFQQYRRAWTRSSAAEAASDQPVLTVPLARWGAAVETITLLDGEKPQTHQLVLPPGTGWATGLRLELHAGEECRRLELSPGLGSCVSTRHAVIDTCPQSGAARLGLIDPAGGVGRIAWPVVADPDVPSIESNCQVAVCLLSGRPLSSGWASGLARLLRTLRRAGRLHSFCLVRQPAGETGRLGLWSSRELSALSKRRLRQLLHDGSGDEPSGDLFATLRRVLDPARWIGHDGPATVLLLTDGAVPLVCEPRQDMEVWARFLELRTRLGHPLAFLASTCNADLVPEERRLLEHLVALGWQATGRQNLLPDWREDQLEDETALLLSLLAQLARRGAAHRSSAPFLQTPALALLSSVGGSLR
jgi:hypothetical protein